MAQSLRSYAMVLAAAAIGMAACAVPAKAVVFGMDVYSGNGTMDWPTIYANGRNFAFVKGTEGTGFQDPKLPENETNGTAAGLYIGAYDFAHPELNTPTAEANYFVNYVSQYNAFAPGHLVSALDLETGNGAHVGASSLSDWCNQWCNRVFTLTGTHPVIYVNTNYATNYLDSSVTGNQLWLANWPAAPGANPPAGSTGPWNGNWTFWQFTDQGHVTGDPSQYADLDKYNGDLNSMIANEVIPTPEPGTLLLVPACGVLLSRRRRA